MLYTGRESGIYFMDDLRAPNPNFGKMKIIKNVFLSYEKYLISKTSLYISYVQNYDMIGWLESQSDENIRSTSVMSS